MTTSELPGLRQVPAAGLRIGYRRLGEGPPVVFLHGFFGDSRVWRRQFELADVYSIVAWDAPGCGGSSLPPPTCRMSEYAATLAAFIEALGIAPAHLVGNSFGGALALQLCANHPEMVRSLALIGAYAGWSGSFPADVVSERLQRSLPDLDLPPADVANKWLPGFVTSSAPAPVIDELETITRDFKPTGMRPMILALAEADLRPVLADVKAPTLLLWGEDDVRSPLSVAGALRDQIQSAELVVIPKAAHLAQVEAADRVNQELRSFLARAPEQGL